MDSADNAPLVYSVSALNRRARVLLEQNIGSVRVEGEISGLARPSSGHIYFSLKDAAAQLRCAFFKQRAGLSGFTPRDGMRVLARGRVSLYEPRGDYQLIVDALRPAGEGELRRAFERLKQKLQKEGLFAAERKRPLPAIPRAVGVITSPTGAAVRDILHILRRRYPAARIVIYPALVQGGGAVENLCAMVDTANTRAECDTLIIARGGGSLEDLMPFNDEQLARRVYASVLPVISGVGHETDITICDLVADSRAPTPTAAAAQAVPDHRELMSRLDQARQNLARHIRFFLRARAQKLDWHERRLRALHPARHLSAMRRRLAAALARLQRARAANGRRRRQQLDYLRTRLGNQSPRAVIAREKQHLASLCKRLQTRAADALKVRCQRLAAAAHSLHTLSPLAVLSRGYSATFNKSGATLTDSRQTTIGEQLKTRLSAGYIVSTVESTHDNARERES